MITSEGVNLISSGVGMYQLSNPVTSRGIDRLKLIGDVVLLMVSIANDRCSSSLSDVAADMRFDGNPKDIACGGNGNGNQRMRCRAILLQREPHLRRLR